MGVAILVTGGAGYIGSHTCVELLQNGYDVIVVDNFSNSKPEALHQVTKITGKKVKTYAVDLQDAQSLAAIFAEHPIETVIHFAGLKAVGESEIIPLRYYQNNLIGTVTLLEVMREYDVKNLVFSSSATVYGDVDQVPIKEEMPLKAINPYGRSKLMIEEVLQDLSRSDRTWSIAILRYFNPIGAHHSGLIGEDPNGIPNNLMPYIAQVAGGKIKRLNIYGNDYPTIDGTGVRDYIHVVDLAVGHLRALEHVATTTGIDAFNLGTGQGYSVLEMVKAFEKASHKSIPYAIVDRRLGDVSNCYADPTKAKEVLNFQAKRGIDHMCADTWRWQLNNPNGFEHILKPASRRSLKPRAMGSF